MINTVLPETVGWDERTFWSIVHLPSLGLRKEWKFSPLSVHVLLEELDREESSLRLAHFIFTSTWMPFFHFLTWWLETPSEMSDSFRWLFLASLPTHFHLDQVPYLCLPVTCCVCMSVTKRSPWHIYLSFILSPDTMADTWGAWIHLYWSHLIVYFWWICHYLAPFAMSGNYFISITMLATRSIR